jgi:diguanylate cyclase (GGDEF)-like protein
MQRTGLPASELDRLAALDSLGLVDTPDEERFDRITELARRLFDVPIALISLITAERQWFKSVQGLNVRELARKDAICARTLEHDGVLVVPDTTIDPTFAELPLVREDPGIRFYAGCAIRFNDQPIGTLCIADIGSRELDAAGERALRHLANFVETELRLQMLSAEQERLIRELDESRRHVLLDELTGTWNRRGVEELLPRELSRASRTEDAVAILLIDIDGFGAINAANGRTAGDAVLQEAARRIRRCIRPHDLLGRHGGDEFLVFLGRCARHDANEIAQRMLAAMETRAVDTGHGTTVSATISIGLYSMQEVAGRSMGQVIEAADQALYRAKDMGRNKVAHY